MLKNIYKPSDRAYISSSVNYQSFGSGRAHNMSLNMYKIVCLYTCKCDQR